MREKPNLCFVARNLGHFSEVWLWRQLVGFQRLTPHAITWIHTNSDTFPTKGINVHHMHFPPNPQDSRGVKRWYIRAVNLVHKNFFGTFGKEKSHISQLITEIQPQVILCHFGWMGLRILPVAKEFNIPIVVHFHAIDLTSSLNNPWYRWSLLSQLNNFSGIVVVNEDQKKWICDQGVSEQKVHIIPCGVPCDEFNNKTESDSKAVRYIAVSRLSEKKGLEYTFRAFAKVLQNISSCELLVVGDGPLRARLESLSYELGIENNICFKGTLPPSQVRELLSFSDIFVQHSVVTASGNCEGSSVAIAEAAASGLPIITTYGSGGSEELVEQGKTGYLINQKDINAMAAAMINLAKDPDLRAAMGKAGRDRMVERFHTKTQIAKLENVLLNCCS